MLCPQTDFRSSCFRMVYRNLPVAPSVGIVLLLRRLASLIDVKGNQLESGYLEASRSSEVGYQDKLVYNLCCTDCNAKPGTGSVLKDQKVIKFGDWRLEICGLCERQHHVSGSKRSL